MDKILLCVHHCIMESLNRVLKTRCIILFNKIVVSLYPKAYLEREASRNSFLLFFFFPFTFQQKLNKFKDKFIISAPKSCSSRVDLSVLYHSFLGLWTKNGNSIPLKAIKAVHAIITNGN